MGRAGDVPLRVRRLLTAPELQHLPLDSADMFILSRLDQPVAITELADLSPVDLEGTMRRVRALAERGAVELFFDEDAEQHDEVRAKKAHNTPSSPFEREESTGLRFKLDVEDPERLSRQRALLGAVALSRVQGGGGVREISTRQKRR